MSASKEHPLHVWRPQNIWRIVRTKIDDLGKESPARLAVIIFMVIISIITALLTTPMATASGKRAPFVDALFTATSAVCVTGLTTVDTATYWSGFGQAVTLVGIYIGGLGVMTLASLLSLAVSRRIGLTQRLLASAEKADSSLGEVGALVKAVIIASLSIELVLWAALTPRFYTAGMNLADATWNGLYMSLSIFNNAGFVSVHGGLSPYVGDWWFNIPLIVGTGMGALGFPVILNLSRHWRRPSLLNLHSKLTLTTYGLLFVIGVIAIALFEWTNPNTLGPLSLNDKIVASLTHGITPRSSGLSTVDVGQMRGSTWFVQDTLMFIGGGSASTGGGLKVTTVAVLFLAIVAEARGDRDMEAFGRRISPQTLRVAVSVAFIGSCIVGASALAMVTITGLPLDVVIFEVISAFATCGLSTGITPTLPDGGKYLLTALMFIGRLGTMTIAAALAMRHRRRVIRMPEERPLIG